MTSGVRKFFSCLMANWLVAMVPSASLAIDTEGIGLRANGQNGNSEAGKIVPFAANVDAPHVDAN